MVVTRSQTNARRGRANGGTVARAAEPEHDEHSDGSTDPTYVPSDSDDGTPSISSGSDDSVSVGSSIGSTGRSHSASAETPSVEPRGEADDSGSETTRSMTLGSETRSESSDSSSLGGFIVADDAVEDGDTAESRIGPGPGEDEDVTDDDADAALTLVSIVRGGPPPAPRKPGRRHPPPRGPVA